MTMTIKDATITKAIKQNTCDYCGGTIRVGHNYLKSTYKGDYIYNWKSHVDCDFIANKLNMFKDCDEEGLTSETFMYFIYETYYELMTIKISSLPKQDRVIIIDELMKINSNHQLEYVIKYYKNLDSEIK
jgi:hypothetical protein